MANSLKILIIEDDLFLAEELQEQLSGLGYNTVGIADNGEEALKLFTSNKPDLILCDIRLEGSKLDGIEIIEIINKLSEVPVVFLTAFGDKDTVERAKKVNPAYYLIKPSNITQLKIALDFALSNFVNNKEANIEHSLSYHNPLENSIYSKQDSFFAKKGEKYIKIEFADLLWVEAMGSNVQIFTDDTKIVISAKLISFSKQVSHKSLLRIHRSFIVNINKIAAFDGGRVFIDYQGEQKEIPIGKTYRTVVKSLFHQLKSD